MTSFMFPCRLSYTSNKDYSDKLYGYLLTQADKYGTISKKNIVYTLIGKILGMSASLVSKKFKYLLENNLIEYVDKINCYRIRKPKECFYAYLPNDIVLKLLDRLITLYVYCFARRKLLPYWCSPSTIESDLGLNTVPNNRLKKFFQELQDMNLVVWEKNKLLKVNRTFDNKKKL